MSLDFLQKTDEFRGLLEAIKSGKRCFSIRGVVEAAKPYILACLAKELKTRIVYILPSSSSLSFIEEQCRFFFSQFSLPHDMNLLPPVADNPYQDVDPPLDSVSSRMKFFRNLTTGRPSLVLTSIFGLLKPFLHPQDMKSLFTSLEKGSLFERDRLLGILFEYGYRKEDLVTSPGEFAWRGGIVDVFSPWESNPFRVEFSGDTVASLREFDPSTQRSLRRMDSMIIPSLREFPASSGFLEHWGQLARKRSKFLRQDVEEKIAALKGGEFFPTFVFLSLLSTEHFVPFTRYLSDALFIIDDLEEIETEWKAAEEDFRVESEGLRSSGIFVLSPEEIYSPSLWKEVKKDAIFFQGIAPSRPKDVFSFPFQPVPRFENKIPFFLHYMKKLQEERERCSIFVSKPGIRQKLNSLLMQHHILSVESEDPFTSTKRAEILLLLGTLKGGFRYPSEKITFFSDKDILTEEKVIVSRPAPKAFLSQFRDLREDDFIVHTDYGIGVFKGLIKLAVDGKNREFIELLYRDDDKLFVPVEDLNLVQKYSAVGANIPSLDKLGTSSWQKTKENTKKAVESMARELLELYAKRKALRGYRFSPGGDWDSEFENIFEFEETEDQLSSIKEIERDMESDSPMDRLLCGDVGYGKTEVAMRASFKAVMDGKQVAILCPTTVLASQHLKTFRNRMVLFPMRTEALTRFQTKIQQKKVIEDLKRGLVDILIGTHRLLSKDVEFRDLGLLVIDEEQRFGVSHKEKIKQMRSNIDVLTLTATPIPRTLNLSLTGLRDISLIETPPKDRLAVHTVVSPFGKKLIASALKLELSRGGQVYYIHNKIEDIDEVARVIERLVPQARVVIIHGKTPNPVLERRMMDFINEKYNVLLSTTIIENGIDIPLVNTLVVDRADQFGLAQLYQLRGRVGRSSRQAFAYFLVPPFAELTPLAKKRLIAIKEFSELGSGFRLAAKDLEIRGAGNLLGFQQHGTMEAVGFDYFMHMLEQTIRELRGEKVEEIKTEINLRTEIRIPEEYLPQINLRLNLYKRISSVDSLEEIRRIREETEDRFGAAPSTVRSLFRYGAVKLLAHKLKVRSIDRLENRIVFTFYPHSSADIARLTKILKKYSGSLTPGGIMTLTLQATNEEGTLEETISILKELYGYNIMN